MSNCVRFPASPPNPGDVVFLTGTGSSAGSSLGQLPAGSFRFTLDNGTEVMRIDPDGTVTVKGTRVDTDKDIYDGFRAWLLHARYASGQGTP